MGVQGCVQRRSEKHVREGLIQKQQELLERHEQRCIEGMRALTLVLQGQGVG